MGNHFTIYPQAVKGYKQDLNTIYNMMSDCNAKSLSIKNNLRGSSGYDGVRRALQNLYNKNAGDGEKLFRMALALEQIVNNYEKTENGLIDAEQPDAALTSGQGTQETFNWSDINWSDVWSFIEDGIISIPPWLRNLLIAMPGFQVYGLLPYILENDYLKTAFWQAIAGDFTDDSNALGVALSVGIGFIPVVGTIADVRDLIADIYNLIDDGPETSEWVALGFSAIGLIPGIGDFLKHGDEAADVLKHADDLADAAKHGDEVTDLLKHGDETLDAVKTGGRTIKQHLEDLRRAGGDLVRGAEKKVDAIKETKVVSAVIDKVDDFKKGFNDGVTKPIASKVDDVLKKTLSENGLKRVDKIKDIMGKNITKDDTVKDAIMDLIKEEFTEATDIPTDLEGWAVDFTEMMEGKEDNVFVGISHVVSGFCSALT